MSDEGAVNFGVICGVVLHHGLPVEAHVSLLHIISSDGPEKYWSKTGGHVSAVYSNKQGEYAINFYWDPTSPLMMGAHFRVRAIHKYKNYIGHENGVLEHRVNMKALSELVFDAYMTKSVLKAFKVKEFLTTARKGVSALKRSTASVEYTPELYGVFAVTDIHLK